LVELIKGLSKREEIEMELVLTKGYIHYTSIIKTDVRIHFLLREGKSNDFKLSIDFYKLAKRINPDLIHVWGNVAAYICIPTQFLLRIPVINNQIAGAPEKFKKQHLISKIPILVANRVIANSLAGLRSYKVPKKKSNVIYNGFDFSRIENLLDKKLILKMLQIETKFVVGMVASFNMYKDYETYVSSAIKVLDNRNDVTFLCIGAGESDIYKKMAKESHPNRIKFLGPKKDVENYMNICDLGVLATYTEGISNAILEFMALGKPVIATDGGGTKEIISDCKSGFLVGKRATEDIAGKINYLLSNPKIYNEYSNESIQIVKNKFSFNKMLDKFEKEYANNVKRKRE